MPAHARLLCFCIAAAGATVAAEPVVNGCAESVAAALPAQNLVQIQYGFINGQLKYEPNCAHVNPGGSIQFTGSGLSGHPLRGGAYTGAGSQQDPASPIPATSSGSSLTVPLNGQGLFGFFCNFHAGSGMIGGVLVGGETVFASDFD